MSSNGEVVIPPDLSTQYNLKLGDKVVFVDHGGRPALVPTFDDPIHQGEGMFADGGGSLIEASLEERARGVARE